MARKSKHTLLVKLEAFKAEMAKEAKTALAEEFKAFFDKHPEVESVSWTQYTPYFNDGDTCEFSANEIDEVTIAGETFEVYWWDGCSDDGSNYRKYGAATSGLSQLIQGLNEYMEVVFGNHCKVVAKRDGTFDVQSYDHD